MRRYFSAKIAAIVFILIIIAVGIYVFFPSRDNGTKSFTYNEFAIKEGHSGKIEQYDKSNAVEGYKGGDKAYYISGKVTSTKNEGFVLITFNLYDDKDELLGTAVAGINKMEKNKDYDFKAVSLIEYESVQKIDHYKLESIK